MALERLRSARIRVSRFMARYAAKRCPLIHLHISFRRVGILVGYYYSKSALSSNLERCAENKRVLQRGKAPASGAKSEVMRDPCEPILDSALT